MYLYFFSFYVSNFENYFLLKSQDHASYNGMKSLNTQNNSCFTCVGSVFNVVAKPLLCTVGNRTDYFFTPGLIGQPERGVCGRC